MLAGRRAPDRLSICCSDCGRIVAGCGKRSAQSDADKPSPAFTEALAAYDQAWTASGLAFTAVTFTDGAATGYGQYTPRDAAVFTDEEALTSMPNRSATAFHENGWQLLPTS